MAGLEPGGSEETTPPHTGTEYFLSKRSVTSVFSCQTLSLHQPTDVKNTRQARKPAGGGMCEMLAWERLL